ncbi:unnamed protein product [Meganyctiphanes norvegica]|uniref:Uncharacterized protein n=1 Tax=Meganyctiphanes norvegica TaxID=48144 RepID=A0AAV2RS05_MEGNR
MFRVPKIVTPDIDLTPADMEVTHSLSRCTSPSSPMAVPSFRLQDYSCDSSGASSPDSSSTYLQVPGSGSDGSQWGRMEPPKTLNIPMVHSGPSMLASDGGGNAAVLLRVPGQSYHQPRRRHSWICG